MIGVETSNIPTCLIWTDEHIQEVRALASEGLSARQIADRVGRTRNSIIGKMRRMGIPLLHSKGPSGVRRKFVMAKVKALQVRKCRPKPSVWDRPVVAQIIPVNDGAGITVLELHHAENCHTVIGSTRPEQGLPRYCGRPAWNETDYCVDHYAMFHRPTQPRHR